MKVLILFLLFSLNSCINAQNNNSSAPNNQPTATRSNDIVDVNLCDLIQSPEKFEQKMVRVKAIYRYGFEWSEIYSLKCKTTKRVWVESKDVKCKDADRVDKMDFAGMGGRTFGVITVGQFTGEKRGYGHMNEFNYLLKVKCFEKAEYLDDKGSVPEALAPEQSQKISEFENSN